MSTLQVTPDRVVLRLTATEKLAAVHGDLAVPRAAITTVELVEDGIGAARGLRAPGLGIPGRRKLGTWRSRTGRQFVDVRRAQPALRIELAPGQRYSRLLVGADDAAGLARQLGRPPTGAKDREVRFDSGAEHLAGTLTIPPGPGPFPAALLIAGSGPLDRDGSTRRLPLAVSRTLAEALAAIGVASLRYDKRGVGASSGTFLAAGLNDNIADARSALAALSALPEVDPARIILIGHSEGAIIAAALATDQPALAGVVLLAEAARRAATTCCCGRPRRSPPPCPHPCGSCCGSPAPTWSPRSAATTPSCGPPPPTSPASAWSGSTRSGCASSSTTTRAST